MNRKSVMIWLVVGLAVFTMACQISNRLGITGTRVPTPTPKSWPYSTFLPPTKSVQVPVNQELQIDSYHVSTEQLESVDIFVNGQKLVTEETSAAGQTDTFPRDLADIRVRTEDEVGPVGGLQIDTQTPGKKISLIWVGRVPGTYELKMVAIDAAGRTGKPIVQLIEVQ